MELLKQTGDAIKRLPPFFKAAFFMWSSVPLWFFGVNIKNYSLLSTTYAIFFTFFWIMGTLSITLITVFRRENKKALRKHAEENSITKLNGQTFAAAMQSNRAYEHLTTLLPAHLTSDLSLYVAVKWGQIGKMLMICMTTFYISVIFFAPQLLK